MDRLLLNIRAKTNQYFLEYKDFAKLLNLLLHGKRIAKSKLLFSFLDLNDNGGLDAHDVVSALQMGMDVVFPGDLYVMCSCLHQKLSAVESNALLSAEEKRKQIASCAVSLPEFAELNADRETDVCRLLLKSFVFPFISKHPSKQRNILRDAAVKNPLLLANHPQMAELQEEAIHMRQMLNKGPAPAKGGLLVKTTSRDLLPSAGKQLVDLLPTSKTAQKALFDEIDKKSRHFLSFGEVEQGLTRLLNSSAGPSQSFDPQPLIHRACRAAAKRSAHGSELAHVELKEFHVLLAYVRLYLQFWHIFKHADSSSDGAINFDEFELCLDDLRSLGIEVGNPKLMFSKLDKNGNGNILFEEFCNWAVSIHLDLQERAETSARAALGSISPGAVLPSEAAATRATNTTNTNTTNFHITTTTTNTNTTAATCGDAVAAAPLSAVPVLEKKPSLHDEYHAEAMFNELIWSTRSVADLLSRPFLLTPSAGQSSRASRPLNPQRGAALALAKIKGSKHEESSHWKALRESLGLGQKNKLVLDTTSLGSEKSDQSMLERCKDENASQVWESTGEVKDKKQEKQMRGKNVRSVLQAASNKLGNFERHFTVTAKSAATLIQQKTASYSYQTSLYGKVLRPSAKPMRQAARDSDSEDDKPDNCLQQISLRKRLMQKVASHHQMMKSASLLPDSFVKPVEPTRPLRGNADSLSPRASRAKHVSGSGASPIAARLQLGLAAAQPETDPLLSQPSSPTPLVPFPPSPRSLPLSSRSPPPALRLHFQSPELLSDNSVGKVEAAMTPRGRSLPSPTHNADPRGVEQSSAGSGSLASKLASTGSPGRGRRSEILRVPRSRVRFSAPVQVRAPALHQTGSPRKRHAERELPNAHKTAPRKEDSAAGSSQGFADFGERRLVSAFEQIGNRVAHGGSQFKYSPFLKRLYHAPHIDKLLFVRCMAALAHFEPPRSGVGVVDKVWLKRVRQEHFFTLLFIWSGLASNKQAAVLPGPLVARFLENLQEATGEGLLHIFFVLLDSDRDGLITSRDVMIAYDNAHCHIIHASLMVMLNIMEEFIAERNTSSQKFRDQFRERYSSESDFTQGPVRVAFADVLAGYVARREVVDGPACLETFKTRYAAPRTKPVTDASKEISLNVPAAVSDITRAVKAAARARRAFSQTAGAAALITRAVRFAGDNRDNDKGDDVDKGQGEIPDAAEGDTDNEVDGAGWDYPETEDISEVVMEGDPDGLEEVAEP